jgi:hypothetical protein
VRIRETFLAIAFGVGVIFQAAADPSTSTLVTTNTTPTTQVPTQQQLSQLAIQATDLNPPTAPAATTIANPKEFYWFTPVPSKSQTEVHWYGNISSRPWAAPGWHVGQTQFADGENQGPGLTVCQFGW